jgi:hypothetical protein
MRKARSGGGITSNKLVTTRAPKAEPRARAQSPSAVSKLGAMQGNHATGQGRNVNVPPPKLDAGRGYQPPSGPTDNVAAVGVGGGRTVYRSGSQGSTPVARPMPPGRDILSEFGPESKRSN